MNSDALFGMALGLQAPWTVTDVSFKADEPTGRELHLRIGFAVGSKFNLKKAVIQVKQAAKPLSV